MAQLRARGVAALPDDDRARRRRLGREPLQAARAGHPQARERADRLGDDRIRGRDRVVVGRLDPQHARGDGGAEADREDGPEHDRHLAEDVARQPLADDPVDPVDRLDGLDPALEHREQRALVPGVGRVLARHETDVGRDPRETLVLVRAEHGEDLDPGDLLGRHHADDPTPLAEGRASA